MKPGSFIRWLVPCAVAVGLAGCFPYHLTDVPAVSGRVVDARSRRPVAGAAIRSALENGPTTRTDARGGIDLPPTQRWIAYIPGVDFGTRYVTVEASGYGSTRVYLPFGERIALDQPIRLDPAPGEKTNSEFLPAPL